MTRGTRITHAILAAWTVQVSRLAAPVTPSPTKQSRREGWQQQIPSWWIPHTKTSVGCDVLSCSWYCKSNPTKCSEKISNVNLDWDDAFEDAYLANLKIASDVDLTGFKLRNPFALDNWRFPLAENLGKYNSTDFKMYCTIWITS